MKTITRRCVVAALPLLLTPALRATDTWTGLNTTWSDPSAWSTNAPPASADDALIAPAIPLNATDTLTLDALPNLTSLTLAPTGPGTLFFQLNGRTVTTSALSISANSQLLSTAVNSNLTGGPFNNAGLFNLSGGPSTRATLVYYLTTASDLTNTGTLSATNGATFDLYAIVSSNTTVVALDNTGGTIAATGTNSFGGSTFTISRINISHSQILTDAQGTISLQGSCTLSNLTFSGNLRSQTSLTLADDTLAGTISGGVITLAGNVTNNAAISGGSSTISFADNTFLNGNGTLTINAGSFNNLTPTASLTIGPNQTVSGTGKVGNNANATITNNGTLLGNIANGLFIAPALINNGVLSATATSKLSIAAFNAANGTLNADGTITLGSSITGALRVTGNGTLAINQNYSTTSPISLANNTLQLRGISNTLTTISGNGTLALTFAVGLGLTPAAATLAPHSGPSTLANLTFANTTIPAGNYLNVTTNPIIFNPTPANKPATLASLQAALTAGASHNAGLFSSTLAPNQTLLLLDNGALPTPFTTFANQPLTTNSLLLTPATFGDANLDNAVDLNDLNTVLNHLGQSTSAWTDGNFDNAPTIDLNDLNFVLNNLGTHTTSPLLPATLPTPEPTTLTLLTPALLLLRPKRRNRQTSESPHHPTPHHPSPPCTHAQP